MLLPWLFVCVYLMYIIINIFFIYLWVINIVINVYCGDRIWGVGVGGNYEFRVMCNVCVLGLCGF